MPTVVNGFLVAITVTDGGDGYLSTPKITITGGGGSGASAIATIKDGKVENVVVVTAGAGYSQPPVVLIDPPTQ